MKFSNEDILRKLGEYQKMTPNKVVIPTITSHNIGWIGSKTALGFDWMTSCLRSRRRMFDDPQRGGKA